LLDRERRTRFLELAQAFNITLQESLRRHPLHREKPGYRFRCGATVAAIILGCERALVEYMWSQIERARLWERQVLVYILWLSIQEIFVRTGLSGQLEEAQLDLRFSCSIAFKMCFQI
jgi:hypothetical protein